MKEYRQMPAAVELVGVREARVKTSLQIENTPWGLLPSATLSWATTAKMREKC